MTRLTKALASVLLLLGSWLALVCELVPMRLPAEIREVVVPVRLLVKSSNIVLYACHLHSCYRYIIMYKKVH